MPWIIAIATVTLIIWYALVGRKWLKSQSWTRGFFDWIEPIELALYQKSETILIGRLLSVGAFLVTVYDGLATFVQSLDLTPVTTRIFDMLHIPQDMRGLSTSAFVGMIGLIISWLRKRTTKPIELVAIPEAAKDRPEVATAIAQADGAKELAVAVVRDKVI